MPRARQDYTWPEGPIGKRNVKWGWMFIGLGALSGSIIGAWAFGGPFPAPPGHDNYADLARRLVRLAHVALFMLPILNILIGKELDGIALSDRGKQLISKLALFAMVGMPGFLLLAGTVHVGFKYLAALPVTALLCALVLMGIGKWRACEAEDS